MALLPQRDYVEILSFECPRCHRYYGNQIFRIGRYPLPSRLHCARGCGLEFDPGESKNVTYKDMTTPTTNP